MRPNATVCLAQDLKENIDAHREPFKQMKVLAWKITDVCLQDDVAYIEVTVSELEARWKELLGLSSGRKKDLDENYKLSQKFFKGAEELLKTLDEAEKSLKDEEPIGVDPTHLRAQLKKHKVCSYFFTYPHPSRLCRVRIALKENECKLCHDMFKGNKLFLLALVSRRLLIVRNAN